MEISSIMIIDDSESDQFLTQIIIKKFDPSIEISQAYDGKEALEKLEKMENQPSIIFLDINMPGMNGFEFLEEYSKREYKSKIVAMLTSSDQEKDKEKSLAYECVKTYFMKPLELSDLESLKNTRCSL